MLPMRLDLKHPGGSTAITVGAGALAVAADALRDWVSGRTVFVVTTPRVHHLHAAALAGVRAAAGRVHVLEVPEGEAAKTLLQAELLWRGMLAAGGKRDSRVLAFGGGSVCDLAGFVAGCFLRGVSVAHVPTTLLAQADAAIGGKTAVDVPEAKNSVGLFHHPDLVIAEAGLLATLPPEEVRSGLVEVIKVAVLFDLELLSRIEKGLDHLLGGDIAALGHVAAASAKLKVDVVTRDPDESGERRLLNLGHTLGHAIETVLDYRNLRHGEAVAYGMLFALLPAVERGLDPAAAERLRALLRRLQLPPLPSLRADALQAVIARDKKALEDGMRWILPTELGRAASIETIPPNEIARHLAAFL